MFNKQKCSENAFWFSLALHCLNLSVVEITVWREKLAKPILLSHWIPSHVSAKIIIIPYMKSRMAGFPVEGCNSFPMLEVIVYIYFHFLQARKDKFARQKMEQPSTTHFRRIQI